MRWLAYTIVPDNPAKSTFKYGYVFTLFTPNLKKLNNPHLKCITTIVNNKCIFQLWISEC